MITSLCVFCGSSTGRGDSYVDAARDFARLLASHEIRIVYGGASVGVMGALADAALDAGGEVVGVIPRQLVDRELAHGGLTELHVVDTMHERKALMSNLADAFVALPGGLGTLEELFEVWTWGMLGIHQKPYGLLNVDGFYDPLIAFLDHACDIGFIRREQRDRLAVDAEGAALLTKLASEVNES